MRNPPAVNEVVSNGTRATITWIAPGTFDISQATNDRVPWWTFETTQSHMNFNTQIMNHATCSIYVNGQLLKTNTSTAQSAVVSCG